MCYINWTVYLCLSKISQSILKIRSHECTSWSFRQHRFYCNIWTLNQKKASCRKLHVLIRKHQQISPMVQLRDVVLASFEFLWPYGCKKWTMHLQFIFMMDIWQTYRQTEIKKKVNNGDCKNKINRNLYQQFENKGVDKIICKYFEKYKL